MDSKISHSLRLFDLFRFPPVDLFRLPPVKNTPPSPTIHDASLFSGVSLTPTLALLAALIVLPLLSKPGQQKGEAATVSTKAATLMKVVTTCFDYSAALAVLMYMSNSIGGKALDPVHVAAAYPVLPLAMSLRDDLMGRVIFRRTTSRAKLAYWHTWAGNLIGLKIVCFVMSSVASMVLFGLVSFPKISGVRDLGWIWLEFMAMTLLKDVTSMNYLHDWMHRKAYWLHKCHHVAKADCQTWHAWQFDLVDVVLENTIGPVLLIGLKLFLGAPVGPWGLPSVHLGSFYLSLISDLNLHSMNPYTVTFFNPLLDLLLKSNVTHNLHHAVNKGYMTTVPYDHLLSRKARQRDMDLYNRVCKTHYPL